MAVCLDEHQLEAYDKVKQAYPYSELLILVSISKNFDLTIAFNLSVMLISVPFLLVTFVIYVSFKELQNLNGKCLICYLFGLIMLYLSFPLIQLGHDFLHDLNWLCVTIGYTAYLSLMICLFWLNVMSFDIFSLFR